ncbi:MAG: metallophosphoesterase family protein [Phycisphaerales bacterium]|jgi:predicted phosphodiesterase|nr:metallophosphoesterase family protein [Phycisphaerales bacterium]
MSRTLILSDIHFGKRSSTVKSVDQLRPLWQGFDALVLNGDTSELHSKYQSDASIKAIDDVIAATDEDDVHLTLLCGNHDPTISDREHLWFHNKATLVFHGHTPINGVAPWSWRCKHIAEHNNKYIQSNGDGFKEQLIATRNASIMAATGRFKQHRPSPLHMMMLGLPAAYSVLKCWWNYPTIVAQWTKQYAPSASFVITGHIHHAGIWKRDGITVINTGCFGFPSHPRAVVIDNDVMKISRIKNSKNNYELGRVCASWNVL